MSANPSWAGREYVRIYSSLPTDHPRVWGDLRLLGGYVRMLLGAEQAWPGLAAVPRSVPGDVLQGLVDDEVVDLVEPDLYRFHGLEAERESRQRAGVAGGRARARASVRDTLGRYLPGRAGADAGYPLDEYAQTEDDAAGRALERGEGEIAGASNGNGRWTSSDESLARQHVQRAEQRRDEPSLQGSGSSSATPPARVRAREGPGEFEVQSARTSVPERPDEDRIDCTSYAEHQQQHRWIAGVGWVCPLCERTRAQSEPTFSEKVAAAAAQQRPDDASPF